MRILLSLSPADDFPYDTVNKHTVQGFIYSLLRDTNFAEYHDRATFKFFCFSDIFPIGDFKAGAEKHLLISSPNRDFIESIRNSLRAGQIFKLGGHKVKIRYKIVQPKLSSRFISASPIVLYEDNLQNRYYSFERNKDLNFFLQRLKEKNKTKEAFKGRTKIEERSFLKLDDEYFEKVKRTSSTDESNRILEHLCKLAFKETGDFKLIEEDYEKIDIFIEFNNEAKRIWNTFSAIMKEDDNKKRREKFLAIKKEFYSYVISVTKEKVGSVCLENGIRYVSLSDLERKYDKETGFISEGGALII